MCFFSFPNKLKLLSALAFFLFGLCVPAHATPFTTTVPGTNLQLPSDYPEAGGVAFVLVGNNGNLYYQFSNPNGAFRGFQNNGNPRRFRGNPFTINDPLTLDCGFSSCSDYFGGGLQEVHIRFTAFDGDTQPGGFDENDISLVLNGFNIGSWSGLPTEATDTTGTQSFGMGTGFGNGTFDTGWFSSTNASLLNNILTTGQTTTQVFDRDPNDNYWDFRRGNSLTNPEIITVAPGYTLEKTADRPTFSAVGEEITYSFVVTNIGSVPIRQLSVNDDKIGSVSCDKTVIFDTSPGGVAEFATCQATYEVTQEDVNAGQVTNIASAVGTPDFGELGELTDTVTVTGPAANPIVEIEKTTTATSFGAVNTTVPYRFEITNRGNVTLSAVSVSDPLIPGLYCPVPDLAPTDSFVCNGTYTVQQSDVDDFAANVANTLDNTASVSARAPSGATVTDTSDLVSLPGTPTLDMELIKTALTADYDAEDDVLTYQIEIRNTGTVTFPAPPTVTDVLTGGATCPTGPVAPGNSVICSATYDVMQSDVDDGSVENTASAEITVGALTASDSDTATVEAVQTTGLELTKRLALASPSNFSAVNVGLSYEYDLTNTGNVTLLAPTVTDDKVAVSCTAPKIAPDQTVTCTSATYQTDQDDLNAGGVTNIASAAATQAGPTPNSIDSNSDSVTVPAQQQPALSLVKTAPVLTAAEFQQGETVTYRFDVTNSGNVEFSSTVNGVTEIEITDDKIGTFTCFATPFAVGSTQSCTASYILSAADILAGTVLNTATASGGATTSAQVSATIAPALNPAISLEKSAITASVAATSDSINYSFLVTNSGNTQILLPAQPISINDGLLDSAADCSAQPSPFDPGDSFVCTGTRTGVSQTELDAGQVDNSATASFSFTNNSTTISVTSDASEATVPVVASPSMVFTKSGPAQFNAVNQTLNYTFNVVNDGNVTLSSVTITDPLIPALSCTLTDIAPGLSDSCTGSYSVQQSDIDLEQILNTATATAQPTQGAQFSETDGATSNVDPAVPSQTATLEKTASRSEFTTVGEQITYTMTVENTGTQTLTNLTVTDALDAGYTCNIASLAPGLTDETCTFVYTVDQGDIDAGQVVNNASLTSADIATQTDSVIVTGPTRSATFDFEKRASGDYTAVGDSVDYVFALENTGNVTLTNVTVTDAFFGSPINCVISSLAPGVTDTTSCTASYTIQQADIDAGSLSNTATATVTAPSGVTAPVSQDSSVTVNGPTESVVLSVVKSFDDGVFTTAAETEDYTFVVSNNGNVTLTGLTINDADLGFTCPLPDLVPGASTSLCADGITSLAATKSLTQADVDVSSYTNTVIVTGESSGLSTAVEAEDEVTIVGPAPAPMISLNKVETFGTTFDAVGQMLTYDYIITNTGNITITADITVTDDRIPDIDCPVLPLAGIPPLGTYTCTGEYEVTQLDLDAGQVVNIASATVTQPIVPQNPGDDPFVVVDSGNATETILASQLPALMLDKRVKSTSPASYSDPLNEVVFEYLVSNSGNVTTTADITIDDDKIPGILTCTTAPLAPGASVLCEQIFVATQDDVDAGFVTNIATADTVFDSSAVQSNTDSVTINSIQAPELGIVKTFVATDSPNNFNPGDELSYTIVVTNTGNVTIDGPITLTDNLSVPSCPALVDNELVPGETLNCTATHFVTDEDIDLGSATNVVFATGSFDGNPVQSPSDNAVYPADSSPALQLTKEALATNVPFDDTTDVITYRYTVTNTGNVALSGAISIEDDVMGTLACRPAAGGGFASLATMESHVCEHDYTITQLDLDRGFVTNNATANTVYAPRGPATAVVSPNAAETVLATEDPELTVSKAMTTLGIVTASAGDDLEYTIEAENTGNQTIAGVSISDPLVPSLTCNVIAVGGASSSAPANVVLEPGETLQCVGDYTVTQDDIDAQTLTNTATATGTDPQGVTISDSDTIAQPLDNPVTTMTVLKELFPAPTGAQAFTDPGQILTFVISVENTGNITLQSATVTDDRLVTPASCTIGPIEPGEIDDSCEFEYVVTQDDVDETNTDGSSLFGGFTNTANVTAVPNNTDLDPIDGSDDVFVRGPPQEPLISLIKESETTEITTWNQRIVYTYTIANTGNTTLFEAPEIDDDKIGIFTCEGIPAAGLSPTEFYQCEAEYFVTHEDLDAGGVTNVAVASSSELPDDATDTLTIDAERSPSVSITKTPSVTEDVAEGETVTYTYVVTNTGNVTLSNVAVSDAHVSAGGTSALTIEGDSLSTDINEIGTSVDSSGDGIWTTLRAGDAVTFTADYVVTQDDIDEQITLTNTATVQADAPGGETANDEADASVTVEDKAPSLEVTKTANATALTDPAVVGQTVTFTINVENSGNQTLDEPTLTDTLTDANGDALTLTDGPDYASGDTNNNDLLDVDETWIYSASFDLDQQAIDAGGVNNTVTATALDPQDEQVTDTLDTPVQVAIARDPQIAVVKTSVANDGGDGRLDVDDTINYTYVVSNVGNTTLFDIAVSETSFSGSGGTPTPGSPSGGADIDGEADGNDLEVGSGTITLTASYAITQDDLDAGLVTNQATASAIDPEGDTVSDLSDDSSTADGENDPTETPLGSDPGLVLEKRGDTSALSTPPVAGETLTFLFTARNTGNVTLTAPTFVDTLTDADGGALALSTQPALTGGDTNNDGFLDVGETWSFEAAYVLEQGALDTGGVENTATATSQDPDGNNVSDVSDDDAGASDSSGDSDATNDPTSVEFSQTSAMEVRKRADLTDPAVDDEITFTIEVENTGNQTLTNVTVADLQTSAAGQVALTTSDETLLTDAGNATGDSVDAADDGSWDTLSPGDVVTFTATYLVTQEDIDGQVALENTATAIATPLNGGSDITAEDTLTVGLEDANAALEVIKTLDASGLSSPPAVGETVPFTITVENKGNQTLTDVVLTDVLRRADGTVLTVDAPVLEAGDAGVSGTLEVDETWSFAVEHVLTQEDIDSGGINNQVFVTAQSPADTAVTDVSDDGDDTNGSASPTALPLPAEPGIEAVKTVTSGVAELGETIEFSITVENTGNVTLSNVGIASDTLTRADGTVLALNNSPVFMGASLGSAAGTLVPEEIATYTATYTLVQADIDAGGIRNSATATGTVPSGGVITDQSDDNDDADGNTSSDPTKFDIEAAPAIALTKALAGSAPATFDTVGQSLEYVFTVENTGNITLTDQVFVSDPLISDAGGLIVCDAMPAGGLLPEAELVCRGTYEVTQEDIDKGQIENSATANSGLVETTEPATATIMAQQNPALAFEKTAPEVASEAFVTGAELSFTFTTRNVGNTTITEPIVVNDTLIAAEGITCPVFPAEGIAPNGSYVCTGIYEVSATDVDLGSVTNIASGTSDDVTSPIDSATIPDDGTPLLSIEKTADVSSFDSVGDELTFTFTVTNAGTRAFARDVVVTDTLLGDVTCFAPTSSDPDFAPGEIATCEAVLTVDQDQLDAGFVFNEAYASTEFGADDTQVLSPPDSVRVDAERSPEISLEKSVATLPVTSVDQVLTYSLIATNVGNQTLSSVEIKDEMLSGFTCTAASLAPDENLTCSGTYTVTQGDIDAGSLVNTAMTSAITPQGQSIDAEDSITVDMPAPAPLMELTKTAVPSTFGQVGSTLTYLFAVENQGNVTLSNLVVTDAMDSTYSCQIASLVPGTTDTTCALSIEVTQDMMDAGEVVNTAFVTGSDPFDTQAQDSDEITTPGPTQIASMEATKVVLPGAAVLGQPVAFQLSVENTGNVTLDSVGVTDTMTTATGTSVTLDAPFALVASSDADQDGALDVGETWVYNAQVTLTQEMLNDGGLENTVTVKADDPNLALVVDTSDDGLDNDGNSADDATLFDIPSEPALAVTKRVTSENTRVGDEVVFVIEALNTGNVDLSDLSVSDTMTSATGTAIAVTPAAVDVPDTLSPGEIATWEVRHVLTQDDIDAGGLVNRAIVTGTPPEGAPVSDMSADDDLSDGNLEDDPTLLSITPTPMLEVIKTVEEIGTAVGETVAFQVTVANTGNVSLTGVSLSDETINLNGDNPRNPTPIFVEASGEPASPEGVLQPGEVATYTVSVDLTLEDIDAGGVSNSVTVTATTPTDASIVDQSDDDGNGDSDPTIASVSALPSFEVTKTLVETSILFPTIERAVFDVMVTNTGNLTQTGISVVDDLESFLAPAELLHDTYPIELMVTGFTAASVNANYDGAVQTQTILGDPTLAPGAVGTVRISFVYASTNGYPTSPNVGSVTSDQLSTPTTAQADLTSEDTDRDGAPDHLESATEDRDGDGIPDREDYDPTGYFYCEEDGRILSGGNVTVTGGGFSQSGVGTTGPITIVQGGSSGFYQFFVTAPGTYTLGLSYPSSGTASTGRTSLGVLDATSLLPSNPASIGSSEFGSTGVLADSSAGANLFYTSFDIEAGDPFVLNNNIPLMNCSTARDVIATKTADRRTVVFGDTINYTLTFQNSSPFDYLGATVYDQLPAGLVYTPGSALVSGIPIEPTIVGGRLSWPVDLLPNGSVTITVAARVVSRGTFGSLTNQTWLENAFGREVSNRATATVRIQPEAIFDCSDVIGKVFDDRNGSGYQDDFSDPSKHEPGIAGVKLVTVDGKIITTDEHGRFSVPCAALPRKIGSNFQLKLDTRSLPSGYRVTTENPRNIRVTAGKVAKLNFGAAISQVITIDLTAKAFVTGKTTISQGLETSMTRLLEKIAEKPTTLRVNYVLTNGETPAEAQARLRVLQRTIQRRWRKIGTYQLKIERSINRTK
ncbi:hypothetical protein Q4544_13970 [Cognatishimia sp. 1_MG-2023]|uniref:DUF7507 domain-containing protein n=1 Tax=Cognatishimia sp. 1_MG-2023 TaxID=3062642 RepID=UPI0026E31CC4|nr:hypothetical protein [Cognatishimia sp. 1_MG-2023]MDO6728044.1 hypothetical protein [Cognatishimia sp. 1_MG-2023]